MTMHLMSHAYSTIRTGRKVRPKMTKANIAKWSEELRVYNKKMKQLGCERKTLDEYIDYVHGITTKQNPLKSFKPLEPQKHWRDEQDKLHREKYPSLMEQQLKDGTFNSECMSKGTKKEPMKYTGTLIKGIATMHKSNAVPVIDEQHAKDIARMRRG